MNFLSWILAYTCLILLAFESVSFLKDTVCRQKNWLQSTVMMTRSLLTEGQTQEIGYDMSCKTAFQRKNQTVRWTRNLKRHDFELGSLEGKL